MVAAARPLTRLDTKRLVLRASDPAMAEAAADFLARNREAHAPWNPPMAPALFTAAGQRERLAASAREEAEGKAVVWWLALHDAPERLIGRIRFAQIERGPFHNAMLGYAIDAAREGHGLMREALVAALADVFERVGLHRVQANARPENTRSLALLERLGFEREGLAREYLCIDGAWRDHVLTALRHPGWPAERAP